MTNTMSDNFSLASLDDNVPSLSLDYPGVLRAWAQLGGDIDLQDESSGTSLSDSIEKWNGVSDTKFLDEELKERVPSASSPIMSTSSNGFGIVSRPPAASCMCSYPYARRKSCLGTIPGMVVKSPFIGVHGPTNRSLQSICAQDHDLFGSSIKPALCSGMVPHFCPPLSYLPMEPFSLGKMDCLGISRPVVPVSSIPSMKQGACGQYGRLVNMSNVQQASKSCSDDQYTTQHAAVGTVVMSKAASSCSLTPATSPPCSLKKGCLSQAPPGMVPCCKDNVAHTRGKVGGNQDKSDSKSTSSMQLRIQLEEMKGWKGRFRTRKQSLDRYMEKKARRLQTKKIRYELRKINADRRPRIKGRFAKKEQFEEYMKNQRAEIEC